MRKNWFFKRALALGLAMVLAVSGGAYAAAEELPLPEPQEVRYSKNGGWITKEFDLPSAPKAQKNSYIEAVNLPAAYDSGAYIERVENQGNNGLCWAFVQNALAVINVKKDEGKSVNYSKTHMAYSTSSENGNPIGFARLVNDGGNSDLSIAYMARGTGLVEEADDPYISTTLPYRSPAEIEGYMTSGYLEEAPRVYGCSLQAAKEMIYEYGAVGARIYYDVRFHNLSTNIYYCNYDVGSNHGVTLVGWNDSMGCFLAMNSWGASWGENGFFWVSYQDMQILDEVFATDYNSEIPPYDGMRSYNNFGVVSWLNSGANRPLYYGTTYDTGDAQLLEGIGVYVVEGETKIEIYVNPYDGDGKTASKFKKVYTNSVKRAGYYHLSFDDPIYLYGDQFNVKIKVSSTRGISTCAPLEMNVDYEDGTPCLENCVFQAGRVYYGGTTGDMILMEDYYDRSYLEETGWSWSMSAYTISDMSWSVDQAVLSLGGAENRITLSGGGTGRFSITRGNGALPLYTDKACTAVYRYNALGAGTYYLKVQNGTRIRQKVVVTESSAAARWSLTGISGMAAPAGGMEISLSGKSFAPSVNYVGSDWNLYALPGGVGKIGKSYTPTAYRTTVYLRITATDGIYSVDYPIRLKGTPNTVGDFSDWSSVSSWAKESMTLSVKYGLLQGSGGKLLPNDSLSRAQAATILLRAAGVDFGQMEAETAAIFGDVKLSEWYAKPVGTASLLGMVSGHRNPGYRAFSPSNSVTREQFAIMALRAKAMAEGVSYDSYINENLSRAKLWILDRNYADLASISGWARDAVIVALYVGVFSGSLVNGRLYVQPTVEITRQQAAVMVSSTFELNLF